MLCLIVSIFFVVMVLITESRGWKNVSHISWINGVTVLSLSLINLAVFTINIIAIADACGVMRTGIKD